MTAWEPYQEKFETRKYYCAIGSSRQQAHLDSHSWAHRNPTAFTSFVYRQMIASIPIRVSSNSHSSLLESLAQLPRRSFWAFGIYRKVKKQSQDGVEDEGARSSRRMADGSSEL